MLFRTGPGSLACHGGSHACFLLIPFTWVILPCHSLRPPTLKPAILIVTPISSRNNQLAQLSLLLLSAHALHKERPLSLVALKCACAALGALSTAVTAEALLRPA